MTTRPKGLRSTAMLSSTRGDTDGPSAANPGPERGGAREATDAVSSKTLLREERGIRGPGTREGGGASGTELCAGPGSGAASRGRGAARTEAILEASRVAR